MCLSAVVVCCAVVRVFCSRLLFKLQNSRWERSSKVELRRDKNRLPSTRCLGHTYIYVCVALVLVITVHDTPTIHGVPTVPPWCLALLYLTPRWVY